MVEKYERDGMVAVLYSPAFGAGWSTWAEFDERELLMFDVNIVQVLLDWREHGKLTEHEAIDQIKMIYGLKNYQSYCGGIFDLQIAWLKKGQLFKITEYDGNESIVLFENDVWDSA